MGLDEKGSKPCLRSTDREAPRYSREKRDAGDRANAWNGLPKSSGDAAAGTHAPPQPQARR